MANIGKLEATLTADMKPLKRNLHTAESAFKRYSRGVSTVLATVKRNVFNLRNAIIALAGAAAVGLLARSFIKAASTSEQFNVRLKVLLRSAKEGGRLFDEMAEFAGKVPFEFEEIMGSATQLAGVMRGGVEEIKQWMPLIGDLAAASGLGIRQTTEQVIRMYSAGAASADLFRERGILAMLGFQAGVSYSAEETRKRLMEAWTKMDSQFRGATQELATTWTGLMSMLKDAWFQFRNAVMEAGLFDFLKAGVRLALDKIRELREGGKLEEWAERISSTVVRVLKSLVIGVADVYDATIPLIRGIYITAWKGWELYSKLPVWAQTIGILGAILFGAKGLAVLAGAAALVVGIESLISRFTEVAATTAEAELQHLNKIEKELAKTQGAIAQAEGKWGVRRYLELQRAREADFKHQAGMSRRRLEMLKAAEVTAKKFGLAPPVEFRPITLENILGKDFEKAGPKVRKFFEDWESGMLRAKALRKAIEEAPAPVWPMDLWTEGMEKVVDSAMRADYWLGELGMTASKALKPTDPERYFAAMEAGKQLTEAMLTPLERYNIALMRINELYDTGAISLETWHRAVDSAAEKYNEFANVVDERTQRMKGYAEDFGDSFIRIMENATAQGTWDFKKMVSAMIVELQRLILQMLVFDKIRTGLTSFISGMFAPKVTEIVKMPGMQHGGRFGAGQPMMVGEAGPEVLVPGMAGTIIPNKALGGDNVEYNQIINVSPGVAEAVRREVMIMMPWLQRAAVEAMMQAIGRGGAAAKSVGVR